MNRKKLLKEQIKNDEKEDQLRQARDFADRLEFQHENDDRERAQKKRHRLFFFSNKANEED